MAIATANQKGSFVYVYDEKGRQLFSRTGELLGYTSHSVTIKRSNFAYTYDDKGRQTQSHPIR